MWLPHLTRVFNKDIKLVIGSLKLIPKHLIAIVSICCEAPQVLILQEDIAISMLGCQRYRFFKHESFIGVKLE